MTLETYTVERITSAKRSFSEWRETVQPLTETIVSLKLLRMETVTVNLKDRQRPDWPRLPLTLIDGCSIMFDTQNSMSETTSRTSIIALIACVLEPLSSRLR